MKEVISSALEESIVYNYWADRLINVEDLELWIETDKKNTSEVSEIEFPLELHQRICEIGKNEPINLFKILLAGYLVLLHKYSEKKDILVAVPLIQLDNVQKNDGQLIYIRINVSDDLTVKNLLDELQKEIQVGYDHHDYFRSKLEQKISLRNQDMASLHHLGFSFDQFTHDFSDDIFSLKFDVETLGEKPSIKISYDCQYYSSAFVEQFTNHYYHVLKQLTNSSKQTVKDIQLTPSTELADILEISKGPVVEWKQPQTLNELFERSAAQFPERTAVVFNDIEYDYGKINELSNQRGWYLRNKMNVAPDDIIAILLPKSENYVVWMLAVLKSGAAFLPIDEDYPAERKKHIIEHSEAKLCITNQGVAQVDIPNETIVLYCDEEDFSPMPIANLPVCITPENLAYIIYTSGSTGKPKGVMIEHGAIANNTHFSIDFYGYVKEDRVLQFTSISFDVSIGDMFCGFGAGAALVLVDKPKQRDFLALSQYIKDKKVSTMSINPTIYKLLDFEGCAIRMINTGGEAPDYKTAIKTSSVVRYFNSYGPSEASVCCAAFEVLPGLSETSYVPIGRPFANSEILILDKNENVVPVGFSGEICISGDGLARGYLNDSDATKQKFVAHPTNQSKLIYKTGDFGKYLPNGDLIFLERKDDQVKIAGHRIELREIEHVIQRNIPVDAVYAAIRKDNSATSHIVIYYVADAPLSADEFRKKLSVYLPLYMVPSFFVKVSDFNRGPNGKLDLDAFPDPFLVQANVEYQAPNTGEQQKMVEIWENILSREPVGVTDNFFQIGGNSLRATLMLSMVYKEFNAKIDYIAFFKEPTIDFISKELKDGKHGSVFEEIQIAPREDYYELSYAQRRLWVLCQFEEDSVAYNMPQTFSFQGGFNVKAFETAITALIERHESLRTLFVLVDGEPKQKILESTPAPIEYHNISATLEKEQFEFVNELYKLEAHKPFDLEAQPPFKFILVDLGQDRHILLFNIHHIINDGWSQNVMLKEVSTIYNSISEGKPNPLPPLKVQYKDYAYWNRSNIESGGLEADEKYWLSKFSDKPNGINLPFDGQRQTIQTFSGGRIPFQIEKGKADIVKEICQKNGATLFMGLISLVNLVMYKYSGQEDIILGAPVAGRQHPDLNDVIGFLANTMVYRVKVDPKASFVDLLNEVKKDALESYNHQEYPFDLLVEKLELTRDLSQSPLFNVMVAHNNTEVGEAEDMAGVSAGSVTLDEDFSIAKFDLLFFLDESGDSVYGELEYNSDLFKAETAQRMINNFLTIVDTIVDAPEDPICNLPFISDEEVATLSNFSFPQKTSIPFIPIQNYVESQALKSPDAVALQFNDQKVTYGELNEQSNRLAHFLESTYQIKKGDVVGVCIERSPDMILTILGIIKTGAAYLGVDPSYPVHRVTYMLSDSKVQYVITDNKYENLFDGYLGTLLQLNDGIKEGLPKYSTDPLCPDNEPDDIVYVIYTSGTTGTPNGARLSHGLLSNLIEWQLNHSGMENNATCLQFTSINFCVSFQEIFMTLGSGGNVVLIDEMKRKDIDYLKNVIEDKAIENLYLPFSYLNFLLNENQRWTSGKLSLKHIVTAGEQLKISTGLRSFLKEYPEIKLHNHYGSSEMHVVTSLTLDANSLGKYTVPPAGVPIANTRILILDEFRQLVPLGVFGELYVQGAYSVPGYINNEELNKGKLVSIDAYSGTFYKTGDVGRWLEDGTIELSGRKDSQLKIRGFRVELGEVEAQILAFPKVMETVVVVRKDSKEQDMLIAYVVLSGSNKTKLKYYLQDHLPYFMVPHISVIEHLPLMPSGKIDRAALPEVNLESTVEYKAPTNKTERLLVEIWEDVLDSKNIGIMDNFFDLGGHSLKATQVITQIFKRINLKLELRNIFINSTIESLAQVVEQASAEVDSDASKLEYTKIPQVDKAPYYPLSNGQARMWITQKMIPGNYSYNILQSYNYHGELDLSVLQKSLDLLVHQYEILRTRFSIIDDEPRQVIMPAGQCQILLKYLDASALEDPQGLLENINDKASTFVFDLGRSPLVNMDVVLLKNQNYVILLTFHHIIADERSMDIFIQRILEYYQGLLADDNFKVDPVRIQYKDFSVWHQKLLTGKVGKKMEAFWSDQFRAGVPVLDLPTDFQRKNTLDFRGNSIGHSFSDEAVAIIRKLASDQGVSTFMIMTAMVNVLLYKYTGQTSLVIGSPTLGREHPDVEDQIGFFVNTLPLLTHLDEEKPFDQLLKQVKQNVLTCYEHQLYPFDLIVSLLKITRENSRNPLFDVMVSYYNQPDLDNETLNHTDSDFSETRNGTSKFDLSFDILDTGSGLYINVEYDIGLFLVERIVRMIKHLESIALEVGQFPTKDLKNIIILSEEENLDFKRQFQEQYRTPYSGKTVVELLEEQAVLSPESVAVYYESKTTTYKTLHERSNQLAHYFRQVHNVKTGSKIALLMQRSEEMVVAILAVLKSGAAYIPIEDDYPVERVHYILNSAEPELLITNVEFSPPDSIPTRVLFFPNAELRKFPKTNLLASISPSDLMYILYTSGSTGEPKGVMIEHRNVVSYIKAWHEELAGEKIDTIYFSTSYCFDPSVLQMFYPLTTGKSIRLLNDVIEVLDVALKDKNIHLDLVPSTISNLLKLKLDTQNVSSIVIGGDRFPEEILHYLDCSKISVRNLYGPTETTVDCMVYKVRGDEQKIPIGSPHEYMQVCILNNALQLQPIGVPGEIYISGNGLARGYIGNQGLTDEVFIAHPFIEGERIYKTGDMGQMLPSGDIDFLGRIDYQVKVRGYRIECEEIESALIEIGAKQAIVLSVEGRGSSFLVAYIVGFQQQDAAQIKSDLGEKLPGYMVPSSIICVDEFPLNSNGKVDRKQLPDPINLKTEFISPTTESQIRIADIWEDILKVDKVGLEDNFFELGGHSLNAVRILSKVSREFNVRIKLSDLFNHPVLEAFTRLVEQSLKFEETSIPSGAVAPNYPLSNGQTRMWITQNMIPDNYSYNMPQSYAYHGELNVKMLQKAMNLIVGEYEILRTQFSIIDGEARQIIIPLEECSIAFEHFDLSSSNQKEEAIQRMQQEDSEFVFDLSNPPLIQVKVIHVENNQYMILLNMHHIISDEWSMDIFTQKVSKYYQNLLENEAYNVPALRIQYKDFVVWQKDKLLGDEGLQMEAFWLDQFQQEIPVLNLPTDFPRKNTMDFTGDSISYSFSREACAGIRELSTRHESSVFMTVLSTIYTLLYKYTEQSEIVIGTPSLGREHSDLDDQIGFFINTLPLLARVDNEESFNELLLKTKEHVLNCYENQFYPFDLIVSSLEVNREASRNPIFDVMVSYFQDTENTESNTERSEFDFGEDTSGTSKFDMTFNIVDSDSGIGLDLTYNVGLFTAERIMRMIKHLEAIILQVGKNPSQKVKEIVMLSEEESDQFEKQLVLDASQPESVDTLTGRVESKVKANPEAVALYYKTEEFTYKVLDEKANQIAGYLQKVHNIKHGAKVVLLLNRSAKMIPAILAVLKTGSAYIPIDPNNPIDRINYILQDAQPDLVVVDDDGIFDKEESKTTYCNLSTVELSSFEENYSIVGIAPTDLAYIIYTSGSTGRPKGVMIEHRNINSLLESWQHELKDEALQVGYFLTSYSFDPSVAEMFMPLVMGKAVRQLDSITEVLEYVDKDTGVMFGSVPSTISALMELGLNTENVVAIKIGGDQLPAGLAHRLEYQKTAIFNAYGPTETTIDSSTHRIHGGEDKIPVGKALSNGQLYILSSTGQPQPIGVPGEIYISGQGVGRGYYNNPELTAKSFVDHPFLPDRKIYKTGDMGQWLPSGDVDFLARTDSQVKVRGFRIELRDVEIGLREIGLLESVVLVHDDVGGVGKILVAYVAGILEAEITEIRRKLSSKLPNYMIPSEWVVLDAIPLNRNGKTDKVKLRQLYRPNTNLKDQEPLTKEEEKVAEVWKRVLQLDHIAVHDNFFERGGHSLKAIQLMALLQSDYDATVKLDDIFQYPTIRSFLDRTRNFNSVKGWTSFHSSLVHSNEYYLIPPILGLSTVYYPLAEKLKSKASVYGMNYSGDFSSEGHADGFKALIEKCVEEILQLHKEGKDMSILGYSFGGIVAFEVVRLLELKGHRPKLVMLDTTTPRPVDNLQEVNIGAIIDKEFSMVKDSISESQREEFITRMTNISLMSKHYMASGSVEASITAFSISSHLEEMTEWENYTEAEFTLNPLSGNHWEVLHPTNLGLIISKI